MSFIKITVCICLQNFRKWQKDYRIWTIAAILFILILENTRKFSDLSADLGVSSSIWQYPFLYSQYHLKLIFTLPLLLMFCNAPFIDQNALFLIVRCKRKAWITGQILYIIVSSAVYYLFIFLCTVITALPSSELSMDWGKCLYTIAYSNAASQLGYSFLSVAGYVIEYFTPIQAVWYTFLLSWLMAIFIGLLIYFLNTISSKRYLGSIVSGIIILFSCYVEAFGFDKQLYFSPVSWSTLNQVDVAEKTNHPSFYYCIGVYCGLSLLLIVLLLAFRKRWKMDIDSK